jgi:hypothetical protein
VFAALREQVAWIELIEPPVWRRSNKHTGLARAVVRLG